MIFRPGQAPPPGDHVAQRLRPEDSAGLAPRWWGAFAPTRSPACVRLAIRGCGLFRIRERRRTRPACSRGAARSSSYLNQRSSVRVKICYRIRTPLCTLQNFDHCVCGDQISHAQRLYDAVRCVRVRGVCLCVWLYPPPTHNPRAKEPYDTSLARITVF